MKFYGMVHGVFNRNIVDRCPEHMLRTSCSLLRASKYLGCRIFFAHLLFASDMRDTWRMRSIMKFYNMIHGVFNRNIVNRCPEHMLHTSCSLLRASKYLGFRIFFAHLLFSLDMGDTWSMRSIRKFYYMVHGVFNRNIVDRCPEHMLHTSCSLLRASKYLGFRDFLRPSAVLIGHGGHMNDALCQEILPYDTWCVQSECSEQMSGAYVAHILFTFEGL